MKNYLFLLLLFMVSAISGQTLDLNGSWSGKYSKNSDYFIYLDLTQNKNRINGILKVEYKWVRHGEPRPFATYKINGRLNDNNLTLAVQEKIRDAMEDELVWCKKEVIGKLEFFKVSGKQKLRIMGKHIVPKENSGSNGFACKPGSFYFIKDDFKRKIEAANEDVKTVTTKAKNIKEESISWNLTDTPPEMLGCENLSKREASSCLRKKMTSFIQSHQDFPKELISQGSLKNFWIVFDISREGRIENIKLNHSKIDPKLKASLSSIIASMPISKAATRKGKKVSVKYELILKFESNFINGSEILTTKNNSIRSVNLLLKDKPTIQSQSKRALTNHIYWFTLFNKSDKEIVALTNSYYDYKNRYSFYLPSHDKNWIEIVLQNPSEHSIKILKSPNPIIPLYTLEGDKKNIKPRSQEVIRLVYNKDFLMSDIMTLLAEIRTQNEKGEYIIYSLFIYIGKQL